MSWAISTTLTTSDAVTNTTILNKVIDEYKINNTWLTSESIEQIEAAKTAVIALMATKTIGDGGGIDFLVSIGGHANPNHLPTPGWANDAITISIYQKSLVAGQVA
jgi:hypothetical protein